MPFVNVLKRSLTWFAGSSQATVDKPVEQPTVRLATLLLAHGCRQGARRIGVYDYDAWAAEDPTRVKVFIQEISAAHIVFFTPALLAEGEFLQLEILLQGLGCWKGTARLQWSLESKPGFRCLALLECSAEDQIRLKRFVDNQLAGARA